MHEHLRKINNKLTLKIPNLILTINVENGNIFILTTCFRGQDEIRKTFYTYEYRWL